MKFVDVRGVIGRARRYLSNASGISEKELEDKDKLAELLRDLSDRITQLEARTPPEATEFEVVCIDGNQVELNHGFGCPIRFQCVHWTNVQPEYGGTSATSAPGLVVNSRSNSNLLVLDCFGSGQAVVRIEPSQYGVWYGT